MELFPHLLAGDLAEMKLQDHFLVGYQVELPWLLAAEEGSRGQECWQ